MRGVGGGVGSGCPTDAAIVLPFLVLPGLEDARTMITVSGLPVEDLVAESRESAKPFLWPKEPLPGERHGLPVDRGFDGTVWLL